MNDSAVRESEKLIETIRASIVGDDTVIESPFGERRVTYADYTASGRSLSFIEAFIQDEVMPMYANTHTESSGTGLQTTRFREDARQIIHDAVGGEDEDVVIFCGSGATSAINKLVDVLNIRLPAKLDDRYNLSQHIPAEDRPVVFIGPYEHHSNELPWRESIADVVTIDENSDGQIDLAHLKRELQRYKDRPLKIGSFSAASNVTGIGSKTGKIAILLHQYGALSFWDFAATGHYVEIEMNMQEEGEDGHLAYKDAIFISPHKVHWWTRYARDFGCQTTSLYQSCSSDAGGGTVSYVNGKEHRYLDCPIHREEGGTPDIVGAIRAGLIFQLKESVGHQAIRDAEESYIQRAVQIWSDHPNIQILGNPNSLETIHRLVYDSRWRTVSTS